VSEPRFIAIEIEIAVKKFCQTNFPFLKEVHKKRQA